MLEQTGVDSFVFSILPPDPRTSEADRWILKKIIYHFILDYSDKDTQLGINHSGDSDCVFWKKNKNVLTHIEGIRRRK